MRSRYVLNEVACHPHDPSSASNVNVLYACIRFQGLSEAEARQRLLDRLAETRKSDPPTEYTFSIPDAWSNHPRARELDSG